MSIKFNVFQTRVTDEGRQVVLFAEIEAESLAHALADMSHTVAYGRSGDGENHYDYTVESISVRPADERDFYDRTYQKWETKRIADDQRLRELKDAFIMVQNTEHWKGPIDKVFSSLSVEQQKLIQQAVRDYAGCTPTFHNMPNGCIRVKAPGYWAAVGA